MNRVHCTNETFTFTSPLDTRHGRGVPPNAGNIYLVSLPT